MVPKFSFASTDKCDSMVKLSAELFIKGILTHDNDQI